MLIDAVLWKEVSRRIRINLLTANSQQQQKKKKKKKKEQEYGAKRDFPSGSDSKASAYHGRDLDSIPESGRSPGEGNGNPFQYSCLENPMDCGTW